MAETSAEEWIASFAGAVGAEAPDEEQIAKLLKLAAVAAHSSERIAAPIACWIAGSADVDVDRAIAEKGPIAQRLAKEAVNRAYESTLETGLDYERKALYLAFASEDAREGLTAFTEKRKPDFVVRAKVKDDVWVTIGAAWSAQLKGGVTGYSLKINTFPAAWNGDALMMPPLETEE